MVIPDNAVAVGKGGRKGGHYMVKIYRTNGVIYISTNIRKEIAKTHLELDYEDDTYAIWLGVPEPLPESIEDLVLYIKMISKEEYNKLSPQVRNENWKVYRKKSVSYPARLEQLGIISNHDKNWFWYVEDQTKNDKKWKDIHKLEFSTWKQSLIIDYDKAEMKLLIGKGEFV
tara:strand:+ start:217 stop:732 length:516 start_codon:yes stop_codon:yes gene_type:complete